MWLPTEEHVLVKLDKEEWEAYKTLTEWISEQVPGVELPTQKHRTVSMKLLKDTHYSLISGKKKLSSGKALKLISTYPMDTKHKGGVTFALGFETISASTRLVLLLEEICLAT